MNVPFDHDHKTVTQHVWNMRFVLPKIAGDEKRRWNSNMNLAVAGATLEDAIATVRTKYPDAVIYGVSHGSLLLRP